MTLAVTMMRRLVLRRGLAALAGAAVAVPQKPYAPMSGFEGVTAGAYGVPQETPCAPPDMAEQKRKNEIEEILRSRSRRLEREQSMRWEAYHNQAPDLVVLASTSQSWRASVMIDRLRAQQSVTDGINEKLQALWRDPLDKMKASVAAWLRGAL